jgi:glucose/mannose-6-phosphate isomerase
MSRREFLTAHDPHNMVGLVEDFPDQCRRALAIAQSTPLPPGQPRPDNILVTGMGGSAAGGDFVAALFDDQGRVPCQVNRDYSVPNWVGPGTLAFVCSYSGQTEETLAAFADLRRRGAMPFVISSGGQISEIARQEGFPLITIPGGQPPRSALGYLLVPIVHVCAYFGLLAPVDWDAFFAVLDGVRAQCGPENEASPTAELAQNLHNRLILLDGQGAAAARVANRVKGQINENAKRMAFASAQPELCHNDIVGREGAHHQSAQWATVALYVSEVSAKMLTRSQVTARLTEGTMPTYELCAPGQTLFERMVGLAYIGDWLSLDLAALGQEDPTAIKSIDTLKAELARVP